MTTSLLRADVAALAPYVPGDQPRETGWVKLNTNEHPDMLPGITDAVRAALDEQVRLYPDPDLLRATRPTSGALRRAAGADHRRQRFRRTARADTARVR